MAGSTCIRHPVVARFRDHWRERGFPGGGDRVAVACSGGLDSLVLAHLLRFSCPELGVVPSIAHFDHRMRAASAADADWVRGLSGAWRLPVHLESVDEPGRGETWARTARYAFLEGLLTASVVDAVLTAHHADDQVETVLFRLARGTGVEGLRGIPADRGAGILRPLLPFSREDLEAYAAAAGIRPRADPTNQSLRYARNRIRHRVLPSLEAVHPGARRGILRAVRNAERTTEALRELVAPHLEALTLSRSATELVLSRPGLLSHGPSVRAELIRAAARALQVNPSESATSTALSFVADAASGRGVHLGGGLGLERSFDRIRLRTEPPVPGGTARGARAEGGEEASATAERILIPTPAAGVGRIRVGGVVYEVRWQPLPESAGTGVGTTDHGGSSVVGSSPGGTSTQYGAWVSKALPEPDLSFPMVVRGWRHGDRASTARGPRRVKRLFAEARIPREVRGTVPVLVGSDGLVAWVASSSVDAGRPESGAVGSGRTWRFGVRPVSPAALCWGS